MTSWDVYVDGFLEEYFRAHPQFAVAQGRHEFDGQLPDWSADGIAHEVQRLVTARDRARAFDSAGLDERQRFEQEYLCAQIRRDLFWLSTVRAPFRNPTYYDLDPNVYVSRPYAPLDERLRAYTTYARAVPNAARQIRANLQTPLPRTFIDVGRITFGGLASYFRDDVPGVFAAVADPSLQAEFATANDGAIEAMTSLDAWLAEQTDDATDHFAMGADVFGEMLRETEGVEVSLERLETLGREDLERNLASLRAVCADYDPGRPIIECLTRVAERKPEAGPVSGARQQLAGLKRFLLDHEIVTIPGAEEALIEQAPPYQRWNLAYIDISGPHEQGLPSTFYISPPDPAWSAEDQRAYLPSEASLLFTTVHEVWPGHFLQFLHSNRSGSRLGQVFIGYAFAEGWAHYAEEMMWEAGLGAGDPEIHIGQLQEALLRNVRYLSAIGLHTGRMSVGDSERMFREQAFQDPGSARQQASRGTYDPGYLNYTLGKMMVRKLRDDWTTPRGGRAAWRAFHDAFLSFGGPPIPLVRRAMLGEAAGSPL